MIVDFLLYISLILILLKLIQKISILGLSPLDNTYDFPDEKFYSKIMAYLYFLCVGIIYLTAVSIVPLAIIHTPINFFQENIINTSHLFFINMYLLFLLIKYSSFNNTKNSPIDGFYFILILAFFSVNIFMTIEPGMY